MEILAVLAEVRKIALFHIFTIRYVLLSDIVFYRVVFLKFVQWPQLSHLRADRAETFGAGPEDVCHHDGSYRKRVSFVPNF